MKKVEAGVILVMLVIPFVMGVDIGTGVGVSVSSEEFEPLIWLCDSRVVYDDVIESGRATGFSDEIWERASNYAFEGEQIRWEVLVMDKNKIEQIIDVVATVNGDVEVECFKEIGDNQHQGEIPSSCNARILEEEIIDFSSSTMAFYECVLTVETASSMQGESWISIEAISVDGSATIDENEYWFLNPVISLSVDGGNLIFDNDGRGVRPGTISYSNTILVGNDAEPGSGVLLDMFITGTDFYDPAPSGARCPVTNRMKLGDNIAEDIASDGSEAMIGELDDRCSINLGSDEIGDHICYYATQGNYGTEDDPRSDAEGYVPIVYANSPNDFSRFGAGSFTTALYNDAEIIGTSSLLTIGGVDYFAGNILSPGAEIAMTFKLGLPEPCTGSFSDGSINFWGEAV